MPVVGDGEDDPTSRVLPYIYLFRFSSFSFPYWYGMTCSIGFFGLLLVVARLLIDGLNWTMTSISLLPISILFYIFSVSCRWVGCGRFGLRGAGKEKAIANKRKGKMSMCCRIRHSVLWHGMSSSSKRALIATRKKRSYQGQNDDRHVGQAV